MFFMPKKIKLGLHRSSEFTGSIKNKHFAQSERFGSFKFDEACFRSANGAMKVKVVDSMPRVLKIS